MSRAANRDRGVPAECFRAILFGEILRAFDRPVTVRADRDLRLPRTGRWERGLAQLRPALGDESLGSTAFALAWRWVSTECGTQGWPSLQRIASHATDCPIAVAEIEELALIDLGGGQQARIVEAEVGREGRSWIYSASFPPGERTTLSVGNPGDLDFHEVDRIAGIVVAWLGGTLDVC